MNAQTIGTIAGIVAASVLSVIQVFHGSAITDLKDGTVHRSTIEVGMANITTWQKEQDRRLDNLEREHDIHEHFEEE